MKHVPYENLIRIFLEEQLLSKRSVQAHPLLMLIDITESKGFGTFQGFSSLKKNPLSI